MIKVAPSLLAADYSRLGEEVAEIERIGVEYLHLDIMDGHFVPNLTFGPEVVAALRAQSRLLFDVHLMVQQPEKFIESFAKAGADLISVHVEACPHLHRVLQQIREWGVTPAVALNPATPIEHVTYILDEVGMVLLMTVNPGFGGQDYLSFVEPKISALKKMLELRNLEVDIEVDGGVNIKTAARAVAAGANVLVAGSFIFGAADRAKAIKNLKNFSREKSKPFSNS